MAYTKYSLTPANNNAAPPDGAPEGMLPSAVNDTMRDMMAQIRDCGDGIRGGTYTMTAPVITGGSINGAAIGASSASTGSFTTLAASSTVSGTGFSNYFASPPALGGTAAAAVSSTNLSYTGTLTGGTGVVNLGSGQFYKDASGNIGLSVTPNWDTYTSVLQVPAGGIGSYTPNLDLTTVQNAYYAGGWKYSGTGLPNRFTLQNGEFIFSNAVTGTVGNAITFTERMRIDSSGNVGIGTSSPSQKLCVSGASIFGAPQTFFVGDDGGSIGAFLNQTASLPMRFNTAGTERMRITSGGTVLVGQTAGSMSVQGILLEPYGTGRFVTNGGADQVCMYLNRIASDGIVQIFQRNNSTVGNISVTTTSTTYNTSSDYRLKENIAPMTGALDIVQQLNPVTYNWKADGSSGQGFIAHELQEVVPDCVTGEKDAVDEEGKPVYQGIDTSFLTATLSAAIQELHEIVKAQAIEIAELKSKL